MAFGIGPGLVQGISAQNGVFYITGIFDALNGQTTIGGNSFPGILQWTNGDWNTLGNGGLGFSDGSSGNGTAVIADTNAVYVLGEWNDSHSFNLAGGLPLPEVKNTTCACVRWVTGPDRPCGSAVFDSGPLNGNTFTFTITGTPGSCWTVQKFDLTSGNWDSLCVVELVNGAVTFTDANAVSMFGNGYHRIPRYRVSNECFTSPPICPLPVVAIGGYHDLAISNGAVWSWGLNVEDELGNGTSGSQVAIPVKANGLSNILAVAAGCYHSLALKSDGTVWAWGLGYSGQLGNGNSGGGTPYCAPNPVQVGNLRIGLLTGVTAISAGWDSGYAVKTNGTVWAWGDNTYGELGDGTKTLRSSPVQVAISDVIAVSGGNSHALALKSDGTVWAWGNNACGRLGNGTTNNSLIPVQANDAANDLTNIVAISAGGSGSYALGSDGKVWSWGDNSSGQLGNNGTANSSTPVDITSFFNGYPIMGISAGQNYCLAVSPRGLLYAWGKNSCGQLGNCSFTQENYPVEFRFSDNSVAVQLAQGSAAGVQGLSLQGDSTLRSWGGNSCFQLGRDGPATCIPDHVTGF